MNKVQSNKEIFYFCAIFFVFFIGVILRFFVFLDYRPLWHDEAPVALTVMQNSYLSMLDNIMDNQKAPILFWFITKFFGYLGNYNEISLRFYPFLCSILSMGVFYLFSRKILSKKISIIIANILFCINYQVLYFSQELKQYSSDILFFMISLLFCSRFINKKFDLKNIVYFILFIILIMFISFPAMFPIAAFFLYKFFDLQKEERKYYITSALVSMFLFFLYYKRFFMSAYTTEIQYQAGYWELGFLTINNFVESLKSLFLYFYYPNATYIFGGILTVIGGLYLFKDDKPFNKLILVSLTFVLLASMLKLYPLYSRVAVYLIPVSILLLVIPFEEKKNMKKLVFSSLLLLTLPMYFYPNYIKNFFKQDCFTIFDAKSALEYVQENYISSDILLINKYSIRTFDYYSQMFGFVPKEFYEYDYRNKTKEEFFAYLDSLDSQKTYWFYCVFAGKHNNEQNWLMEWKEKNITRVKEEYIKGKSYILKIE